LVQKILFSKLEMV